MNDEWQKKINDNRDLYIRLDLEPIIKRLDRIIGKNESLESLSIINTTKRIKMLLKQDNEPDTWGNIKAETFNKAASLVREHLAENQDEIFNHIVDELLSSVDKGEVNNALIDDLKTVYHDCSSIQFMTRSLQYSVWQAEAKNKHI